MSGHLDDLAAALADGELDHDQRDRALAHLAGCDPCRAEVDAQRRLKALIANQPDPEVSPDLTMRLTALVRTAAGPNRPDVVRVSVTVSQRPLGARPQPVAKRSRSLRRRAATVSALGVALVAGVAAVGGGAEGPRVRPPVANFVDEHNATTTRLGPLNDPGGNVVLTSFGR
jgi:anti-sigma factor RsiW